ncbi:MAG: methyltransferase domain-containing protein [Coriobacteriia bacterium]|nr:methyltransferase domain-containing protein [Coriobacteriia bacterium]
MSEIRIPGTPSDKIAGILEGIPQEVIDGTITSGFPFPPAMDGIRVLVLGCGTGRDAYIASALVGEDGLVIGVDPDPEKIAIARKAAPANCQFLVQELTNLEALVDGEIDLVISNCGISAPINTQAVLDEIWRVSAYGAELFACDVFADRRMIAPIKACPIKRAAGTGSALYIEDFRRQMTAAGWADFRHMRTVGTGTDDPDFEGITFFVRTVRAYKIPDKIEDLCEQYNQVATYKGGIEGCEDYYDLDDHHRFVKDEPLEVCGNSCSMVQDTRVGKYFEIQGNRNVHYGPYPGCGNIPYTADDGEVVTSSCC